MPMNRRGFLMSAAAVAFAASVSGPVQAQVQEEKPKVLSGAERYANKLYSDAYKTVSANGPTAETDKPSLLMIGHERFDSKVPGTKREPATQGCYLQGAVLQAANKLHEGNVVLCVDLAPESLKAFTKSLNAKGMTLEEAKMPMAHAIKFAMDHDIPVVGIDPLAKDEDHQIPGAEFEPRHEAMRGALTDVAKQSAGKVVLAFVDSDKIHNFHGIPDVDVMTGKNIRTLGNIKYDPTQNPMNGFFSKQVHFSGHDMDQLEMRNLVAGAKLTDAADPTSEEALTLRQMIGAHNYIARNNLAIRPPNNVNGVSGQEIYKMVGEAAEAHVPEQAKPAADQVKPATLDDLSRNL